MLLKKKENVMGVTTKDLLARKTKEKILLSGVRTRKHL